MDDTDPDARELAMFFNRILQKPYYTGVVNYKGVLFPGNHKPLITKELFDKVLTVLSTRRQGVRLPSSSGHPSCTDHVSVGEDVQYELAQEV